LRPPHLGFGLRFVPGHLVGLGLCPGVDGGDEIAECHERPPRWRCSEHAVTLKAAHCLPSVTLPEERGGVRASLVAFDLLRLEGQDQRLRPLEAR
jgi:hypothetical protein